MSFKSAKEKFEMSAILPIVPVMSSSYKNTILYTVYIMVLHVLSLKKSCCHIIHTCTTTINKNDHKQDITETNVKMWTNP